MATTTTIILGLLALASWLIVDVFGDPEPAAGARPSRSGAVPTSDASISWPSDVKPLAVDRQQLGYFRRNSPEGLVAELSPSLVRDGELYVLALRNYPRAFNGTQRGFRVIVGNATDEPVKLLVRESSRVRPALLAIVQQALDPFGRWVAIEYLPSVYCDYSWYGAWLPAGIYLDLVAPHYAGGFATRLRIAVRLKDEHGWGRVIYSNEFAGRIDLRQLVSPSDAEVSLFAE